MRASSDVVRTRFKKLFRATVPLVVTTVFSASSGSIYLEAGQILVIVRLVRTTVPLAAISVGNDPSSSTVFSGI